jgi:hypothetical protein
VGGGQTQTVHGAHACVWTCAGGREEGPAARVGEQGMAGMQEEGYYDDVEGIWVEEPSMSHPNERRGSAVPPGADYDGPFLFSLCISWWEFIFSFLS